MADIVIDNLKTNFDFDENLVSNPALKILYDYALKAKEHVGYCQDLDYFLNDLTSKVFNEEFKEKPFSFIKDSVGNLSSLHISKEISDKHDVNLVAKVIWYIVHSTNFTPSDFSTLKNVLAEFVDILKKKEMFIDINNEDIDSAVNVAFDMFHISKKSS